MLNCTEGSKIWIKENNALWKEATVLSVVKENDNFLITYVLQNSKVRFFIRLNQKIIILRPKFPVLMF